MNLPKQLLLWFEKRQTSLSHRQLLVISGQLEWATNAVFTLLSNESKQNILWVGDTQTDYENIRIKNYRSKLGQEYNFVIFNCFDGFRANAAMALSGTIKSNGLMIVLCPDLAIWPNFADPEQANRISYGYRDDKINSLFIQHLISSFKQDNSVAMLSVDNFHGEASFVKDNGVVNRFYEQQSAVKSICKVSQGHRNRPLVLTADRGRGKSSALGIAAAELMQKSPKTIYVTAPNIHNVEQVFAHIKRLLPEAIITKNAIEYQASSITFKPLDLLISENFSVDLLFVDEASSIPVNILGKIAEKFSRVVFSTTVHGYEGSGRGFEIKFKQLLAKIKPEYKTLHLSEPIRWFKEDQLEQFWFNTLFHKSALIDKQQPIPDTGIICKELSRLSLLKNKKTLEDIFELLTAAHYQTSPDDLQRLLDAPETKCFVLTQGSSVIGVAHIVEEGSNKLQDIAVQVAENSKRVKGHLVAQNIAAIYNHAEFCVSKQWRVSRIAILPSHQRTGLASMLLAYIEQQSIKQNVEFLTTSFGCNASLLKFWFQNEYLTVKLSLKPEISSGEHSCICIKPLTESAKEMTNSITANFSHDLLFYMDKELNKLSVNILLALFPYLKNTKQEFNQQILKQFIIGDRNLVGCRRIVVCGLLTKLNEVKNLNADESGFIVAFLLQNRSTQQIKNTYQVSGKKQIEQKVRSIMAKLICHYK